ncbi:MAG: TonB-dependent receptor [Bdellovibrionaceae bacterium]|nr:TonB-dependent receptor [Pseudobdellovibrionaceae bacterium]
MAFQIFSAVVFAFLFFAPFLTHAQTEETALPTILVSPELERQKSSWLLAPGSFVLQNEEELQKKQAKSLDDIFRGEPGVEFTGGPRPQAELPQIRGLDASRILILEDGARQNFQSGHNGRVFSDASFLESVEVVKGPWSSLYGSGALGGVISMQRPTAQSYLRRTGKTHGFELMGDYQSANNGTGARVTGFAKMGFFEPLISVRTDKGGDIRQGGGDKLPYSASDSLDLYSALGFDVSPEHRLVLKVGERKSEAIVPLNPNEEGTGAANETGRSQITKRDFILDHTWKQGSLIDYQMRAYHRQSEVRKNRLSDDREDIQKVETSGVDLWNHFASSMSEDWESVVTLGFEYFEDVQRGSRNGGALGSFPDAKGSQLGVSLQPQFIWNEKTKFAPGIRYDKYRLTDAAGGLAANEGDELSGKFYIVQEYAEQSSFFLGYGQGYNAPRLADLYVTGLHIPFPGPFPPPNFFEANPDLKPERSESVEAGVKNRFGDADGTWILDGTLYATETKDFIVRQVDIPGGKTRLENLSDKALLYGAEMQAGYETSRYGTLLSYAQTRGNDRKTKEALPDLPGAKWSLRLEGYGGEARAHVVGSDVQYVERQGDVPSGIEASSAFVVQDLYWNYGRSRRSGGSYALRVNNLWDLKYRRNGSAMNETGRDVRLQASWLF